MTSDSLGTWPRRRAVKSADHPAILFRDHATSYAELAARVDRLAAALQARGVGFGDRVAYLGNNHPSFVETLFASTLLGAVFVPLNTRLSIPELEYMLQDSEAMLLVSGSELEPTASAAAGSGIRRIVIDDPDPEDPVSIADDTEDYEQLIRDAPAAPRPATVTLEDRALIIYTSGTTGRPKGAVLTHGNLTWNAINVLVDYDLTSADRSLMISPLFHVAALGMGCLPVILKGATLLLEERFVSGDALRSIERLRATTVSGVPTTFQLIMDDPAWTSTDISSLRLLTCGGSPVPDRVRAAYEARGLSFSGGYGMTEASPGVTMLPPKYSQQRGASAGLAHFFTEFRIRGADGRVLGPHERGEIETAGANVFLEYWENAPATAEAFTDDRWLRTGDVGYVDDDGFLYIVDRSKDMIISGGENVYSAEVEQAIAAIPGVTGVAVIGVPHERWGEVPHAVITLAPGQSLDPGEMVAHLSSRLARYKVPKTIEIVDELPRTASGKVRKAVLRERYDSESEA
ncbi:long-chain fatty acid--CoA ligase [Lysinimonas soli]|uniref:Long-chain fatty acid--CoA ligase n=1 Tax=Lysinimonas soli TaxID=1074233 RepID=A0ABW0NQ24_9MICO